MSSGKNTGPETWEEDARRLSEGDFPYHYPEKRGGSLFPFWVAMCPSPSTGPATSQTCCRSQAPLHVVLMLNPSPSSKNPMHFMQF